MKRLNNHGVSLVEIIVTFSIVMVIVGGLMGIIMNYRLQAQSSFSKLELQTYKNTLTKEIQDDILNLGLSNINEEGSCSSVENRNRFASCANLVFKDGTEKILAISKIGQDDRDSLEHKYIFYDDERHVIQDSLPKKIPSGRHAIDFQSIFVYDGNFVSSDSTFLSDGTEVKIFSIDIPIEHIDYEEDFGLHIVASNADFLSTNAMITEFQYIGENYQEYSAPADGTYRIELWGASGGNIGTYLGGKGAYTSGYITLKKGQTLYVYVGGQGTNTDVGGFNGGESLRTGQHIYGSSGGGATDVRLIGGSWDDFNGLKSRIMVAAGGGGANYRNTTSEKEGKLYGSGNGGAGGGIIGYTGEASSYADVTGGFESYPSHCYGTGGTQVSGGSRRCFNPSGAQLNSGVTGGFGKSLTVTSISQSGGGGGWYTGGHSDNGAAGGGSSYISGHPGCQAVDQLSTEGSVRHKPVSEHDSFAFNDTTMIDGEGYVWTSATQPTTKQSMPSNGVTTVKEGNVGNGYARITYLGL